MGLNAITATASIKVGSVMARVIVEMGKMKAIAQQVSMASAKISLFAKKIYLGQ